MDIPEKLHRCEDLWFEDGTVILQAENTLFRVYRGILASQSRVFRDLFTVPQPENESTMMGHPFVSLSDDASDVRHFLKAISEVGYYQLAIKTDFTVLVSVLRLSEKYDAQHFRVLAIQQLKHLFPSTIEEWDKRDSDVVESIPARPFIAALFAHKYHIPSILPAAYYCICTHPIERIFDGYPDSHGALTLLDDAAQRACVVGRRDLCVAMRKRVLSFLRILRRTDCASPAACEAGRRLEMTTHFVRDRCDVFLPYKWSRLAERLCASCLEHAKASVEEARKQVWEEMPEMFGLPPWEELRRLSE